MTDRRDHAIAISADALALHWARAEGAAEGSVVVVGREISPRGRNGRLWTVEPERSVAVAIVVRPDLPASGADGLWLAAGLATADAIEDAGGTNARTRWPDGVVDEDGGGLAALKVSYELGPGTVRSAVVVARTDLDASAIARGDRTPFVEFLQRRVVAEAAALGPDAAGVAARYGERSGLVGRRVSVDLVPQGTTRGRVQGFTASGALLLGESVTVSEKVPVDAVADLAVAAT